MFISDHLICWFAVQNYAKRSFSRLKMLVIHVWYMIFNYIIIRVHSAFSLVASCVLLESLSRRRFCQHGRQPEVNRAVIDGEWWRQPFSFEITNVKAE